MKQRNKIYRFGCVWWLGLLSLFSGNAFGRDYAYLGSEGLVLQKNGSTRLIEIKGVIIGESGLSFDRKSNSIFFHCFEFSSNSNVVFGVDVNSEVVTRHGAGIYPCLVDGIVYCFRIVDGKNVFGELRESGFVAWPGEVPFVGLLSKCGANQIVINRPLLDPHKSIYVFDLGKRDGYIVELPEAYQFVGFGEVNNLCLVFDKNSKEVGYYCLDSNHFKYLMSLNGNDSVLSISNDEKRLLVNRVETHTKYIFFDYESRFVESVDVYTGNTKEVLGLGLAVGQMIEVPEL